ncbi:MAG: hypothetical protein JWM46_117 [Candidatus Kaiserbacteria bacterium]|nr:hypothetical protein [Candidatus Kaiserbacteria bacterium]
MKMIDSLLNKITMYRLVVYELIFLLCVAGIMGSFGVLSYSPAFLAFSTAVIFCACWFVNRVFAYVFEAPYNPESTWITALILALIITPPTTWLDPQYLSLALWASAWAMASKYMFAIGKKHLFNPAAAGVAMTSVFLGLSASWWVGTPVLAPFVVVGGLLIVRKIHRFDLWWSFMTVFTGGILYFIIDYQLGLGQALSQSFLTAPVFFFGTVMLTEPLTAPATRWWRMLYGAGIAILILPNVSIGSFYFSPELALLAGNIAAYIVSPKQKLVLKLKEKIRLSRDVFEFVFALPERVAFKPGQYMEWTLAHAGADSRSIRRYFTIASAPEDSDLRLGVKFYSPSSTFKKALFAMQPGDTIVAAQRAGDFTLPRNREKRLVFIAGGIGVTPFRSMIQHMLDTGEKRPVTVLFANKTPDDVVYRDMFDRAQRELGIKTVYAFSDAPDASGTRFIDRAAIEREIPQYEDCLFYISGPQGMVTSLKDMLGELGIKRRNIKTDYFPGFA